ncbi:MAG: hypothetical protein ABTD50_10980 [Polyangiaceae bacterium]|jgi:hypothetical protein
MLGLLFAATTGAGAAAVPTGDQTAVSLPASHALRNGLVFGFSLGAGFGRGSGYPNDNSKIGDPSYYSSSGWMGGTGESLFVLGALTDSLSFGFFYQGAVYRSADFRSSGAGGGLRVEAFPLVGVAPRFAGLGVLAEFGIGTASLDSTKDPSAPQAGGTQSFGGVGAFYEWSFGHLFGGHFAVGPSVEYDAIWTQPFDRNGLLASLRIAFYGGP